ncbi:putative F-box protein At1g65770 [Rosa rugosa]|uniref:putative F-box protein At1g65770 n=1 Tax=Rosa rugosa TaxID=74645 RepID=UPI002B404230|nr:putative F-box protein At1g65770 [Rosa rugosa]
MCLLDLVTDSLVRYEFNLLDFRLVELRKSYVLKDTEYVCFPVDSVQKVVVMTDEHLNIDNVYAVFMIFKRGNLGFVRVGDENLINVDEQNSDYHDIIIDEGQYYWGIISWVNSALEVIQFSPPICGSGGQKHLVESCGDLYVVVQYGATLTCQGNRRVRYSHQEDEYPEAIGFKVCKLDQEWGNYKWVNVKDLGDRVFILSNDGSFSVSTREFAGVKGNCIFFIAQASARCYSCVFSLEDGRIRNLASSECSQMVQPPSNLLNPN